MPPHPLTNFKIKKYFQNESKFNGVYSRNSLNKREDRENVKNFDTYASIGAHWIGLDVKDNNVTYFHSFAVEPIVKEITKVIRNKYALRNVNKIQAYHLLQLLNF